VALEFDPIDFVGKLAAVVPRPRSDLVRYHGCLAPHASLRADVVKDGRRPPPTAADGSVRLVMPRFAIVLPLVLASCTHDPTQRIASGREAPPPATPSASASVSVPSLGEPITATGLTVTMVAPPATGTPVDRLGDPLPAGAIARFGTTRLHHGGVVDGLARFGEHIVSIGAGIGRHGPPINFWDAKSGRLAATAEADMPRMIAADVKGELMVIATMSDAYVLSRPDAKIQSVALPKRAGLIRDVAITRDGETLAVLRDDGCEVDLYGVAPLRHVKSIACAAPLPGNLAISDDGTLLAVADEEGGLFFIDVKTSKVMPGPALPKALRDPPALAFVPRSSELMEARADGTLARWIARAPRRLFEVSDAFEGEARAISISDDGRTVAVGSIAGHADTTLLDASNGAKRWERENDGWANYSYSVAFDSGRLAVGTSKGSIEYLDPKDGSTVHLHQGGEGDVNAVAFLDEDRVLSFGSQIEQWSITSPHAPPIRPLADEDFNDFIVDAQGDTLIARGNEGLTKVSTRDWSRAGSLADLGGGFLGASSDGRQVFLGDFGTFLRIDTVAMRKLPPLSGVSENRTADCVAVSADGARVAAVLEEPKGRPRLYHWENPGRAPRIQEFLGDAEDTLTCAFASTGALAIGTQRGIHLVQKDGKSKQVIEGRYLWRIVADPRRPRVAFADADDKIALLDLATGTVREVGQHLDNVEELAFSPSGDRLASASSDDSVIIWDGR
jgi:WD40 repeat protein